METRRIPGRVALFVSAVVLVLQTGAVGAEAGGNHHGHDKEVTFTKWILSGGPFMAGFTGGDAEGDFLGEVFENVPRCRLSLGRRRPADLAGSDNMTVGGQGFHGFVMEPA